MLATGAEEISFGTFIFGLIIIATFYYDIGWFSFAKDEIVHDCKGILLSEAKKRKIREETVDETLDEAVRKYEYATWDYERWLKSQLEEKKPLHKDKEKGGYLVLLDENKKERKKDMDKKVVKVGDAIYARTHAEFLNKLLGLHLKAWMKCGRNLADGKVLWMIDLGDFITPSGWINRQVSATRISEYHVGLQFDYQHNTYQNAKEDGSWWNGNDRVIFDIVKLESGRKYVFRGVYRVNREESKTNENIWDLVTDEYTF